MLNNFYGQVCETIDYNNDHSTIKTYVRHIISRYIILNNLTMIRSATVSANPTTYSAIATALARENMTPIAPPYE